jgi:hypothetical protein
LKTLSMSVTDYETSVAVTATEWQSAGSLWTFSDAIQDFRLSQRWLWRFLFSGI